MKNEHSNGNILGRVLDAISFFGLTELFNKNLAKCLLANSIMFSVRRTFKRSALGMAIDQHGIPLFCRLR